MAVWRTSSHLGAAAHQSPREHAGMANLPDRHELPRTLVVVATYNEAKNIESLLDAILGQVPHVDVLIVDDNSPDGTGQIVDAYAERDSRVSALHRAKKKGLGSALLAAFRHALDRDYELVATMDGDFSHKPSYLPDLFAGMVDHDVMIGSRYIAGGGVTGWDWSRKFMSSGINIYSRALLGIKARDCSGGFRCYRVAKLREIDFDAIESRGYSFMEEFLYRCQQVNCRLGETPIIFENRKFGKSKINRREIYKALWILLKLALGWGKGGDRPVGKADETNATHVGS